MSIVLIALLFVLVSVSSVVARPRGRHNTTRESLILDCLYDANLNNTKWGESRLDLITTRTTHPFVMSIMSRAMDTGVGEKLRTQGLWDPQILGPMQYILEDRPCDEDTFMMDVGANIGFFSLFSLSLGCDVAMFEPQGPALTALRASLCINEHIYRKKRQKFQLVPMPVSDSTSVQFPLAGVKNSKNVGGAGIADCNRPEVHCQEFKTVQLDNFMYGPMKTFQQARIRVMKVDVEGYEAGVFASMAQILSKKAVDNILFEIVPYINGLERNEAIFTQLLEAGYSIAECPFTFAEGVREINRPYIRKVEPLDRDGISKVLREMTKVGNSDKLRGNWKNKHYSDFWATLTPALFGKYNEAVIPGA